MWDRVREADSVLNNLCLLGHVDSSDTKGGILKRDFEKNQIRICRQELSAQPRMSLTNPDQYTSLTINYLLKAMRIFYD